MRIVNATYVRNEVEPGWQILSEEIPLGQRYRVDLDAVQRMVMVNRELGKSIILDCIYVLSPGRPGWLPLMALKVEES